MSKTAVTAALALGAGYLLLRTDPATGQSPLSALLGGGSGGSDGGGLGDQPLSPLTQDPFPAFDANGDGVIDDADRRSIYTPSPDPTFLDGGGLVPAPSREPGFLARAFSPENLGFAALLTLPALARGAPAAGRAVASGASAAASGLSRGGSAVVRSVGTAARATGQAASRVAPRLATAARFATTGAAGTATGVAGGLALGQGAVTILQRTGALDAIAQGSARQPVSTTQRQAALAGVAPVAYLGAVSSGLAGQGSVRQNVGEVNTAVRQTTQRAAVQTARVVAPVVQAVRSTNVQNFNRGVGRIGSSIRRLF